MKFRHLAPATFMLLLSCAQIPSITPLTSKPFSDQAAECDRVFPAGNWQFLHTVKAELPGEKMLVSLGLTVISSHPRSVRSVIMTVEGLVVFDAEYEQHLTVHRAFAPFDSKEFAEGLMDDIRLIFFKPDGPLTAYGQSAEGSIVCRHNNPDGRIIDISLNQDGTWEVSRYDRAQRLTRKVKAMAPKWKDTGFPATIELDAQGNQNYTLEMTLLDAVAARP